MAVGVERQLVTIFAEALLEGRLTEELSRLGATGYSVSHADGRGSRGVRASDWEGPNVRIDTIVSERVADAILSHLAAHYFENYAVIAYATTVRVARPEKYD